jgi:hypothetical protein
VELFFSFCRDRDQDQGLTHASIVLLCYIPNPFGELLNCRDKEKIIEDLGSIVKKQNRTSSPSQTQLSSLLKRKLRLA